MEPWLSNNFVTEFVSKNPKDYRKLVVLEPKFSEKPSRPSKSFIDIDLYKNLNKTKDSIETSGEWNKWSKLTNPYEKIPKISRSSKEEKTIPRSYFKMCELLTYFGPELDLSKEKINTLHLCEAPGFFIKSALKIYPNANWHAQTLYDGSYSNKIDDEFKNNTEQWIKNGDGDLYKLDNIKDLSLKLPKKANLITGDGSFDVSYDPNNQEQLSLQLIYSQVVTALHCQEIGGTFMCKIFDSVTKPTCQLIDMLTNYYEKVYLIKPRNSRYVNSEKYLVAIKFKGCSDEDLDIFDSVVAKWQDSTGDHLPFCRDFGIEQHDYFKKRMLKYNTDIIHNQVEYISMSLDGTQYTPNFARSLEAFQNKLAQEFCENFELTTNSFKHQSHSCKHIKTRQSNISNNIRKCERCLKLIV